MEVGQSGSQILAVIPARGGSKRILKKNIRPFNGKAMIEWTIEAALDVGIFEDILVSTDCPTTAKISRAAGALVPFFRQEALDDYSPASLATLHALMQMEEYTGKQYDVIVQLMPNCPLRNAEDIASQVADFFSDETRNSCISAFSYGMFNPWWAHKTNEQGEWKPLFSEQLKGNRSQDLPKLLCPSGAIWISTRERLIAEKTYYSSGYRFLEMHWMRAVDIDDEQDMDLGNIIFSMLMQREND